MALAIAAVVGAAGCGDDSKQATADDSIDPAAPIVIDSDPTRVAYGEAPQQFGDLYLPSWVGSDPTARADSPALPVVVLIHGGFWRSQFELDLMVPLAEDLAGRGYAVWNIEYRRVAQPGGGYPGTLEDVAAAVDLLATFAGSWPLDLDRVAVVGHSAGGHLALWSGQRERLPSGTVGADPGVIIRFAVGQAPIPDLEAAHEQGIGGAAVSDLMGGPPAGLAGAYAVASPAALLPVAAEQLIVHGAADSVVPLSLSRDYEMLVNASSAPGPTPLEVVAVAGADHFDVIDPTHASWAAVVAALDARFTPATP